MKTRIITLFVLSVLAVSSVSAAPQPQADDPSPPEDVVKLIFIHHSSGENWLTDGYGDLGLTLGQNNYFVSDTNYGWGLDSIGDRTDIPNWVEWFRSENTPTYMEALFNESGQNSSYTRDLSDPGGENEIILFKSCFPNSDLGGNPDDPAGTYEDLTVSGAKYVYNEILEYFATRPDKLFIVITAPPLSSPSEPENARAFNDWLSENDYPYNNVAVFDFYNVLTHRDAHHWYQDGEIQHVTTSRDTLAYPSEDDHPSVAGSQKATDEFIPLLNVYYHRWQAGSAQLPPAEAPAEPAAAGGEAPLNVSGVVDDFESGAPEGTNGWESYADEATPSSLHCAPDSAATYEGEYALNIDFDIQPNAWGTCAIFYGDPQDWSASDGLSFYLQASEPGLVFDVDVYVAGDDEQETYLVTMEAPEGSQSDWTPFALYWSDFQRAAWEADAGTELTRTDRIQGIAFGIGTGEAASTGRLYIDNISLTGVETETSEEQAEGGGGGWLPCGSALILPLFAATLWILKSSRRQ